MHSLLLLHHSFPSPLLPRRLSSRHLKSFFISEIARAPPNPELRYRRLIVTTQCAEDEKVQTTDDEYPVGFPSYKKGTCVHAFLLDFWIISEKYLSTP